MNQSRKKTGMEPTGRPEELFAERERRMAAAVRLQQPDRIPIVLKAGYLLAEMGGVSKQALLENPEEAQRIKETVAMDLQPDAIAGVFPPEPWPFLALGDRMTRFPGHGLPSDSEYQFLEKEFMTAEDYDRFLADPTDWAIRTYLPRAYGELEGLGKLPPLGTLLGGSYNVLRLGAFSAPPVMASFRAFADAIRSSSEVVRRMMQGNKRMAALGFVPAFMNSPIAPLAPFDFMANTLRGMKGIMMDMFQRPDRLLAAQEAVSRIQLEAAIGLSRAAGINHCIFFLHRGSDGFMSLGQFEKFYWPQLKHMMLTLIENGITPYAFYEGAWDRRLEYLAELPKGKTVGWFQSSDIFRVKEVLGNTMCIAGGMPVSRLVSGTAGEVRAYTRKVCRTVGDGGGFIMCTNVGEMSGCRPELVRAWVAATREYGQYSAGA